MTQRLLSHIVLAAFALISFSGRIEAQIVQCIDEAGSTTFSNAPCEAGSVDKENMDTSHDAPRLVARKVRYDGKFAAAEDARTAMRANKRFPERQLASDIATMKAAKVSAVAIDQAHALARKLKANGRKI